eukprot:6207435-Pleurochrysis_carterae.AAC.4
MGRWIQIVSACAGWRRGVRGVPSSTAARRRRRPGERRWVHTAGYERFSCAHLYATCVTPAHANPTFVMACCLMRDAALLVSPDLHMRMRSSVGHNVKGL